MELIYSYFPWGGLESVLHDEDHDGIRNTSPGSEERLISYAYDFTGNLRSTSNSLVLTGEAPSLPELLTDRLYEKRNTRD